MLIVAGGVAGMVALVKSKPEREPLGVEERVWTVAVVAVEPGRVTPQLVLFALVDSPHITHLSSAITADVKVVEALEGQRAGVGDRLITLDDREARLALDQAGAEVAELEADIENETLRHRSDLSAHKHEKKLLELAQREVERARNLAQLNMGSELKLDQALSEVQRRLLALEQRGLAVRGHKSRAKRLEAKLAQARTRQSRVRLDLERTRIHPPFEGRITEVFVSPGDRVRPGDRLLTMFDAAALELRAQIPLRHLSVVRAALDRGERIGARAMVDGREIRAVLHRLTAQVGRGSGGADGLFQVVEGSAWLQLGRTVELILDLPPTPDAVAVPREALYGADRVFVLDGERMKSVRVKRLGETFPRDGDGRVIVRSPRLGVSDQVIVTKLPNAIDGLKVRVVRGQGESQGIVPDMSPAPVRAAPVRE